MVTRARVSGCVVESCQPDVITEVTICQAGNKPWRMWELGVPTGAARRCIEGGALIAHVKPPGGRIVAVPTRISGLVLRTGKLELQSEGPASHVLV